MGQFYVNYVVRSDNRSAVVAALQGRRAFVTPVQHGCIIVADEVSVFQDGEEIEALTCFLSSRLSCPVLAFINHDDGLLCYCLAQEGAIVHSYTSCFGYFDESLGDLPRCGNARALCSAFGSPEHERVERILRKSSSDADARFSASDRHADLVAALGIPAFSVGFGYNHGGDRSILAAHSSRYRQPEPVPFSASRHRRPPRRWQWRPPRPIRPPLSNAHRNLLLQSVATTA